MRVISAKLWVRVLSLALVFLPCQLVGQKSSAPEWEDPAVFERNQEPLPFEDIVGPRYPTPDALEQLAREPKEKDNRPSFMDEYCAATGNSLGHFQEFWDLIYKYRRLTGGAVWDWPSPGITAKIISTPDLGPHRNDGCLMGRPRLLPGRFGNAVALSGHDDWVELYRHPALDLAGSALTLEAWIFPRRWNGTGSFITKGNHQFALQQIAADKIEFAIQGGARFSLVSELPRPWEGQWHHVAAVYDGALLGLFIDGAPAGAQECRGKIRNTPFPINIGKNAEVHGQEHAGELCNALIDEVRVYDRVRTEVQIREDMDSTGARDAILYLPFDTAEERGEFFSLGIGGRSYGLIWPDRVPQPEMWQLKKSPQPVHIRAIDLLTGRVEITNRYHFTNLNTLRLLWSVQGDDRVLQSGETTLELAAGQSRTLNLPLARPTLQAGTECRLLLRFLLKQKQPWAAAGHEVAFEEFDLPYSVPPGPAMPAGMASDLKFEESASSIRVGHPEGCYECDRGSGRLVSAVFRGVDLFKEGPRANVWRAPLCNETDQWGRRSADQWYRLQLDSLKETPVSVRTERPPGEVRVHISTRLAPPEGDTAFGNEYSYRFFPSGDVVLELEVKPSGAQPRWLPKVGLQMVLPEAFSRFSWYGRGPVETYPDRKTGAKFGLYSGTVQEQYLRYLVPQDYGNKTDVRWALLSNPRGLGLLVIPAHPLNVSVQHFRTDNLSRAWYPFQLTPGDGMTLNVDAVTTGVGETPINTLPAYRALPEPVKFAVRLKPVDTARDRPMELKRQRWPSL